MSEDQVYLTPEGAEDLRRELAELIEVRRPELALKLKEAVSQGDLKENADYHAAKEQQAFVEGRIQYLENILNAAQIIDNIKSNGVVGLGSTVTILEIGADVEEVYRIVGVAEANPREGKISQKSPIGAALIGKRKGDKVRAQTPSGEIVFKILSIE
jgi:transcription elongation factor GreA